MQGMKKISRDDSISMNIQQSFSFLSISPPDSLIVCVEPAGSPEFQAPCSSAISVEDQ